MELRLQKYRYADNEYLIYDCSQEQFIIKNEEIRVMCSANFGIDVKSMLVGPVIHKGKLSFLAYNADGTPTEADDDAAYVFRKYLSDKGYIKRIKESKARKMSRIYLYDHFIIDNNFRCIEKKEAI